MKKFFINFSAITFLLIALFWISTSQADQFKIDPEHSSVGFQIRHIFSKVNGNFNQFGGTFDFDQAKKTGGNLKINIITKSIDTNNEKRDKHLKTADFFDVEKFPEIKFSSTKVENGGGNKYKVQGYLTIHGKTNLVDLDVEFLGAGKDPWGNEKAGFTASTKINRKDFDIVWNKTLDAGGLMLGEEVTISLEVEANKQ